MTSMKHAFTVAAILFAGAQPTFAADLGSPRRTEEPAKYEHMPALWRGFYAGVSLGASATAVDIRGVGKDSDLEGRAATLGAFVGYNFTNGPWVWGVETDFTGHGVGKSKTSAVAGLGDITARNGALGSLRLRGGYAWNNVLFYGTAGVALTQLDVTSSLGGKSQLRTGAVIGLGAEWAFDKHWTGRIEGLAYVFTNDTDQLAGAKRETLAGTSTVRLGIARRF